GGAIACGSSRLLNRAVYYCDFGRYQNPLPEGRAQFVSDANVAYRVAALDQIRSEWASGFQEFPAHQALVEKGWQIWLTPRITAWQNRGKMTLGAALKERYMWGRAFAGIRFDGKPAGRRLAYACLSPFLPALLTFRLIRKAIVDGQRLGKFLPSLPHVALLN